MRRHSHPSTLAGATLLVAMLVALALNRALPSDAGSAPLTPSEPVDGAAGVPVARARWTSNVRTAPRPDAEVVAVLPAGREASLVGRAGAGAWLLVAYPPEGPEGWLPAQRLDADSALIQQLPEVSPPAPTPHAGDDSALPDLTITEIYVVSGDRLAFRLQNLGDGALVSAQLGLALTVPGASEPAGLTVDVATLEPGETAAVVTPVVLSTSGEITIELDPDGAIEETDEANNTLTADIAVAGEPS